MPNFSRAEISNTTEDLTSYRNFLRKLNVGQTVTLPLEEGETSRKVMRALNAAAVESSMRLARLPSADGSVRFRVVPPQKRTVNISEEARRKRAEKARATRAARSAASESA
ncbi:MAG TPA: hypothetical protein VHN78_13415 [Chloroflexota bacterium]|nr:hypothetical protein [Chloroflexota bacterium]